MTSTVPRDPEKNMDFYYSSGKWKNVLGADDAETICVPPCLDVLKRWQRNDLDEAPHLAPNILGQKGEAAFMQKFQELNMGGILVSGLGTCDLIASQAVPKEIIEDGEWDAIFFHQYRGIFVIEVKATETNDENIIKKQLEKAKTQLHRNIKNIERSFLSLYRKECTCITGIICFPFRNENCKTFEGYRVIDKSKLDDRATFKKFFEPQTNETMDEAYLFHSFVAEFVCCRSQIEFHSQAYNAMQVATWVQEQNIARNQNLSNLVIMPENGPSGKIILTAQQLEIVEWREKCVTIRGAPGSGKTLILMQRALKAAMENKPGSVFVFVNEKLKAKYEHYFFKERYKIFKDDDDNIDRTPNVLTIDKISFAQPEDDIFFDETPIEDFYIKKILSRVNCSGRTTVVFTGLHKPSEADALFRLYRPRLKAFKHFEMMKVLRSTGNIFKTWDHYYPHGITIGHNIHGAAVINNNFDSFQQVQNEIANKITNLTSTNATNTSLPALKNQHIAVITCDDHDSTEMRNYFEAKEISCGHVNEQARRLPGTSIVAVDVYLNTPSYEWPIVLIILKPGVTKEDVMPIAASRCIASLTILTYKKATASSIKASEPQPMEEEIIKESNQTPSTSSTLLSQSNMEDWHKKLETIQSSLRRMYSKSYRNLNPFSWPYFFDIESKWVNITLKREVDSTVTEDYADLLKKAFAKAEMLIMEGDPGVGKSSLLHRLAYEWTQLRLSDYDLVLYTELRKLREHEFKDINELITHYMKGYLEEEDYELFHKFINDTRLRKKHKILVLLDGYDESALEKQCQELIDYSNNPIGRALQFDVLITSRKGYLSKFCNQGRFTFADIIGFTTESQRQEYISKHFNATNDVESSENAAAVTRLLNTNANLTSLSETPLMLTFICLLHKKTIDGTEVELYMNIIWLTIDRYQRSNPNLDVPSVFGFEHDTRDKFDVIQNNYQNFPQLHLLGKMAMQDIFKTTFTETDLSDFQLKDILQEVGLLRKEVTRDSSYRTKTEYSFLHRSIQEFIMALTFFFCNEEPNEHFCWHVFQSGRYLGYGIIQVRIETFLNMIYSQDNNISKSRKNIYSQLVKPKTLTLPTFPILSQDRINALQSQNDISHLSREYNKKMPQSQEEAITMVQDEANQGDAVAQYVLGVMYYLGIIKTQSHEDAIKWFTKSAEQGETKAQFGLGVMYKKGQGVPQSDEEAVKWFTKAAEQGETKAQFGLGVMYEKGQGVPQSDEEAVKWYRNSAEQGNANAQVNLGVMYKKGQGVPQSNEEAVKWYRNSAEQGNANAQVNLGVMYKKGQGVPQSDEEAIKWYRKSAEQGNANAQVNLGVMYSEGRGVPQSNEEAVEWYRKSAEQGNANAQFGLGVMYEKGQGVPQSNEEAVEWYRKSAEQGSADAQYNLGVMFNKGQGVPLSDEEAVEWFTKAAKQGEAGAQYNLGVMFNKGQGVPLSDEEAVEWFTKAAKQGEAGAQYNLGSMYENGDGVRQSYEEAVKWYRKSAEQGNADAQNNLGQMYANGRGGPQSDKEAVKWYRKSAEQGNADAQNNLGNMYNNGDGVRQSYEEAVKWYRKSAEQGNADAQNNLGQMYANGRGGPQSDKEAVKWYRKSAEQGNADAQNNLGQMYENGDGVRQSYEEAVKWYRKSAVQGHTYAQNNLGKMYENGEGVRQSGKEAVKWYRKAAEQGDADAQSNLGYKYRNGQGVRQSYQEAVKWYRKAAEQGDADAQFNLGEMYENGEGVRQSDEEAVKWYIKAVLQGDANAYYNLALLYKNQRFVPQSVQEAFTRYTEPPEW